MDAHHSKQGSTALYDGFFYNIYEIERRRNMFKKLITLLAIASMSCTLAACEFPNSQAGPKKEAEKQTDSEKEREEAKFKEQEKEWKALDKSSKKAEIGDCFYQYRFDSSNQWTEYFGFGDLYKQIEKLADENAFAKKFVEEAKPVMKGYEKLDYYDQLGFDAYTKLLFSKKYYNQDLGDVVEVWSGHSKKKDLHYTLLFTELLKEKSDLPKKCYYAGYYYQDAKGNNKAMEVKNMTPYHHVSPKTDITFNKKKLSKKNYVDSLNQFLEKNDSFMYFLDHYLTTGYADYLPKAEKKAKKKAEAEKKKAKERKGTLKITGQHFNVTEKEFVKLLNKYYFKGTLKDSMISDIPDLNGRGIAINKSGVLYFTCDTNGYVNLIVVGDNGSYKEGLTEIAQFEQFLLQLTSIRQKDLNTLHANYNNMIEKGKTDSDIQAAGQTGGSTTRDGINLTLLSQAKNGSFENLNNISLQIGPEVAE